MEFTGNIVGYASSVVSMSSVALLWSGFSSEVRYQWIDYFCSFWRIPLFIQCVIGAILAAGSLVMPESPRYALFT